MTLKEFRALTWKVVYDNDAIGCKVFASEAAPGLTIHHDTGRSRRTVIKYRAAGRFTDSPSQALKWHNQYIRRAATGTVEPAPGEPPALR